MNKEINAMELDFLLRYPAQPGVTSPVDFLSSYSWGGIKVAVLTQNKSIIGRDNALYIILGKIV